ncbi:MAG: putative DNA binding domain-containing protein [Bacteroidales bacterium]|nr:putative DNA binding domain-containing protein [Bacteroidales bacterium]
MKGILDINNIGAYRENNRIEAKKAKGGLPNSIWETYSSFANTDGGIILLGVDENKDHSLIITGVEDAHKLESVFWNMVNNRQKVNLNILTNRMVKVHEVEGKQILSIEVPRADRRQRPVYVGPDPTKGTYRRDFEGDYLCTVDQVAALFRDASNESIDQRVLSDADMDALDKETITRFRNRFRQFHSTHIWNDDDDEQFLRHIGASAVCKDDMKFHPTAAGLLMFGHEYDIVREFPHYFLDYQEKLSKDTRWTHRITSSSGDWSGNLYDFFFRVFPRLTSDLPIPFVTNGIDRIDNTRLHLAVREALLNSIVHADHYGRQGIVITKSTNSISFANPGDIRIGLKAALQGGVSDPRNETIMKMFSLVDIGERAGSGIPDMIATWQKYLKQTPEYNIGNSPTRTQFSLQYNIKALQEAGELLASEEGGLRQDKSGLQSGLESGLQSGLGNKKSGLSETAQKILQLIEDNPTITYDEISIRLGKARSGIAKHIKNLKEKGFIKK